MKINKKIGIVTHYYKSTNYGGVLQAYALTDYLNHHSLPAEQIQIVHEVTNLKKQKNNIQRFLNPPLRKIPLKLAQTLNKEKLNARRLDRENAFSDFRNNKIPHSNDIYSRKNIYKIDDEYRYYITGSDQVWNTQWYNPSYFLDFVKSPSKILSYAASMPLSELSENERRIISPLLKRFRAISVREKQTLPLLKKIGINNSRLVIDPVFLLSKEEWSVLSSDRGEDGKYIFAYLLGTSRKNRLLINKISQITHLRVINILNPNGDDLLANIGLQASNLSDASPADFISLIQNSQYVITDSFHALAFSIIFKKKFLVLDRDADSKHSMNSRIINLLDLINGQKLYIPSTRKAKASECTSILESVEIADVKKLNELIAESKSFLEDVTNK